MLIAEIAEPDATGPLAEYYEHTRQQWGFLPNFALAFSHRPDVAQAWNALNVTVRESMDRRRFEIVTIAASRALHSTYCTAAHSTFLRDVCGDEETMRSIALDPSGSALSEQDRAVYDFGTKLATNAMLIERADIDRLRAVGLADADIADLVFAVAARSFFTRVLDGVGIQLDPEIAATFSGAVLEAMVVGRAVAQ
ncbi:MAG TPA: peroxidase-related enzyme [Jatrophihabitans sp.]|jgi:uncharacterized peroxidase-related enzyme